MSDVIQVNCECGRVIRTNDQNAGKRAKCPDCGEIVRLPGATSALLKEDSPRPRTPEGKTSDKSRLRNTRQPKPLDDEEFDRTFKTNVYAYFRLVKAALPHLEAGAAIIVTGSETGFEGPEQLPDYAATKGAIHTLTKVLAKQLAELEARLARSRAEELIAAARQINGVAVVTGRIDGLDADGLRSVADTLRDRLGSGVVCVGSVVDGKVNLVAAVTHDLTKRFQAGRIMQEVARIVGGRGANWRRESAPPILVTSTCMGLRLNSTIALKLEH